MRLFFSVKKRTDLSARIDTDMHLPEALFLKSAKATILNGVLAQPRQIVSAPQTPWLPSKPEFANLLCSFNTGSEGDEKLKAVLAAAL
jgi:hypothetical protein